MVVAVELDRTARLSHKADAVERGMIASRGEVVGVGCVVSRSRGSGKYFKSLKTFVRIYACASETHRGKTSPPHAPCLVH